MAAKKKANGEAKPELSKAEFVRQHPNKSAAELVELAKAQGMPLKLEAIYTYRAKDKKRGKKRSRKEAVHTNGVTIPVRASNGQDTKQLHSLVKRHGVEWAKGVIGRIEKAIDLA